MKSQARAMTSLAGWAGLTICPAAWAGLAAAETILGAGGTMRALQVDRLQRRRDLAAAETGEASGSCWNCRDCRGEGDTAPEEEGAGSCWCNQARPSQWNSICLVVNILKKILLSINVRVAAL